MRISSMNRDILKSERSANRERPPLLDMLTKLGVSSTLYRAMPLLAGTLASRYAQAADVPNKRIVFMYLPNGAPLHRVNGCLNHKKQK